MFLHKFNAYKIVGASLALMAMLFFSACSSRLDGNYSDESGLVEFKFESNGKVYASAMGIETELEYEVDGDKVKIISPKGNQIYRLQDDGTLSGPMGIKLTKKD